VPRTYFIMIILHYGMLLCAGIQRDARDTKIVNYILLLLSLWVLRGSVILQEARRRYAAVTELLLSYASITYYNIILLLCVSCIVNVSFCVFGMKKIKINVLTRFLYYTYRIVFCDLIRSATDDIIFSMANSTCAE